MFNLFPIENGVCAPIGFYCDGVSAGLKANSQLDIAFIYADSLCDVEGIFTKNKFCFILNAINNSEDLLWQKKMFNM